MWGRYVGSWRHRRPGIQSCQRSTKGPVVNPQTRNPRGRLGRALAPGQSQKTVTVQVRGDRTRERDEYFLVRLADPSHATIDRGTAVATVRNDD
jgi:hypothetical protein